MEKIYFAGPLFNEAERSFNLDLTQHLESAGFEVYLPQRDGIESDRAPYDAMPKEEKRVAMFNLDIKKILEADIFLFVLDGRVPDEGACVELGVAYLDKVRTKKDKLLVGLQTDKRAAFLGSRLNPMIRVPLDFIGDSKESLQNFLKNRII